MANGRCRIHGGRSPGAPKSNQNAYKHGRYSEAAIRERRRLSVILASMAAFIAAVR